MGIGGPFASIVRTRSAVSSDTDCLSSFARRRRIDRGDRAGARGRVVDGPGRRLGPAAAVEVEVEEEGVERARREEVRDRKTCVVSRSASVVKWEAVWVICLMQSIYPKERNIRQGG